MGTIKKNKKNAVCLIITLCFYTQILNINVY